MKSESLLARKVVVVVGLGANGAIHLLDLLSKWNEVRYIGILYIGIVIASVVLAERILTNGVKIDFQAAAALLAAILIGYVVNRTIGMPNAKEDIGNWTEPLGWIFVFIAAWTMFQALVCVRLVRSSE